MVMRIRPSGVSHCQPIQSSEKPSRISAPSPNSSALIGSDARAAFWNVTRIRFEPRFPAS